MAACGIFVSNKKTAYETEPTLRAAPAPDVKDMVVALETGGEKDASVVAIGYFNRAEDRDSAWETSRLAYAKRDCSGSPPIITRSVRWYPATAVSGEACAVIVYTAACQPISQDLEDRLALDRKNLLARDPYQPMEHACGEKNRKNIRIVNTTQEEADVKDAAKIAGLVSASASCQIDRKQPVESIHAFPDTIITTRTRVHPAILDRVRSGLLNGWRYSEVAEKGMLILAYRDHKQDPTIARSTIAKHNAHNIFVTQTYARGFHGRGYCVQISATQGWKHWAKSIWRPAFLPDQGDNALDEMGLARDVEHYWHPYSDGMRIAYDLGRDIGF